MFTQYVDADTLVTVLSICIGAGIPTAIIIIVLYCIPPRRVK